MSEFASSMAFVVPYNPLLGSPGPQGPKNVSQPWIEALSSTSRLTLVVISDDVSLCEDLLRKAFPMLHEIHICRPVSGWRKSLKRLMCMVKMLPPAIVEGDSPEFKALLPRLKNQCEIFHFEYFTLAQSIALIKPDRPVFLHGHDAYSLFQRRLMADAETPKEWLLSLLRWVMFRRLENTYFSCASELFTVSPIDQRYLIGRGVFRAKYLPPPMLAKEMPVPITRPSMAPELLCLVAATYQASQHAILELVVSALADSSNGASGEKPKLTLLGRSAKELKQALGDTLPIDAVCYVNDYEGFISGKNWICFYPQRVGAGLHTKIRDVMLAKVPVVGFAEIMEAFGGRSGADYVSCHSEHQAVKALQDLLVSASLRVQMGEAGAKLLKDRFGRSRVQKCYQNIIKLASPQLHGEKDGAGMVVDLRALQAAQLTVAVRVKDVCDRHNIPYFLVAGTLLGAVRHQGCIPWDDDLDMGMLRKDFDRFIQVAQSELGADLFVQTLATDPHMPFPFAKIRLAETLVRESASRHCKWQSGVFIDIFPLDGVPDGFLSKTRQKIELRVLSMLLLAKCNFTLPGVDAVFWKYLLFTGVIQPLSKFLPRVVLVRMFESAARRYSSFETEMVMATGGSYGYQKESVKRAWFEHRVKKPFGVHEFSCPAGWQSYLSRFYGDYMTPPPEGQRFNRHGILNMVLRDWQ